MKYFTKKQQQILKDNKFEVIENSKAYFFNDNNAIYLQIYTGKLFIRKVTALKSEIEIFLTFKEFSQRYLFVENI